MVDVIIKISSSNSWFSNKRDVELHIIELEPKNISEPEDDRRGVSNLRKVLGDFNEIIKDTAYFRWG